MEAKQAIRFREANRYEWGQMVAKQNTQAIANEISKSLTP